MSTDIRIKKKIANGYETFYPTNNAHNVIRNTNNFNYIDGTTLLEVIQDIANKYVAHKCGNWKVTEEFSSDIINKNTVLSGDGKFICMFTPQNINNTHNMIIGISYGEVWKIAYYNNNNVETQINQIWGVKVKKVLGGYCAVITGTSSTSSTILNSYTVFFPMYNNSDIVYDAVTIFNGNKIPLIQGGE